MQDSRTSHLGFEGKQLVLKCWLHGGAGGGEPGGRQRKAD